jgi:centromere/kinetochore protein ZW10
MVPRGESPHLAAADDTPTEDVWDAAWESDEEPVKSTGTTPPRFERHRSSLEEEQAATISPLPIPADIENHADGAADEWGWGDDEVEAADAPANPEPTSANAPLPSTAVGNDLREITIAEKYWTSSMPQPVLETVIKIYEDASALTQEE